MMRVFVAQTMCEFDEICLIATNLPETEPQIA
jgi:hypothetical protein